MLAPFERRAFLLLERMNSPSWKRAWVPLQRVVGARWVGALVRRRLRVSGLEHVVRTSPERPLLLVANHRTYFDLFVISAILYRELGRHRPIRINFPVRGRGYYQTVSGVLLNGMAGFWAMYPPLFSLPSHQVFDRYAVELLIGLCREGRGNVIGIHPEGTRSRNPDPYAFQKLQPGTGRIIHAARPQVVPVFVTGLSNSLWSLVRVARRRDLPVRVRFGPEPGLGDLLDLPAKGSTYKAITERVMAGVREQAEADRREFAATG